MRLISSPLPMAPVISVLLRDSVLEETDDHEWGHGIEKAPDIRGAHPGYLFPEEMPGVEEASSAIVLAAPRPENHGEKREEVFLVDCFRDQTVANAVWTISSCLPAQNAQRRFGNQHRM